MTHRKLCLTLCLSILPTAARAAAPVNRAAEAPTPEAIYNASEIASAQPAEPESLPDLPPVQSRILTFRSQSAEQSLPTDRSSRFSFGSPRSAGVSVLASMPLADAVRHLGAERFNTDDGSMLDDFAICYRMSARASIEIIPGDPAPVKLPVVSVANNTGVTIGLVVRLSK